MVNFQSTTAIPAKSPSKTKAAEASTTTSTESPQEGYFSKSWRIPGTKWTLAGRSRASERTGFWIPQLQVLINAGIDLPVMPGSIEPIRPSAIFLTNGNLEHINALPMLLRHEAGAGEAPMHIFAPTDIVSRLRQWTQAASMVHVQPKRVSTKTPSSKKAESAAAPVVVAPSPGMRKSSLKFRGPTSPPLPSVENRPKPPEVDDPRDDLTKKWHAAIPDATAQINVGPEHDIPLIVDTFQGLHTSHHTHRSVPGMGYILSTPASVTKTLRPEFEGPTRRETGRRVQAAKKRGLDIYQVAKAPELPKLALVLDVTVDIIEPMLKASRSTSAPLLQKCPVVMVECRFLNYVVDEKSAHDHNMTRASGEALPPSYVCWPDLKGIIRQYQSATSCSKRMERKTWVLIHFDMKYRDSDILAFFDDPEQCGILLQTEPLSDNVSSTPPPADIVLWLDAGPCELWVQSWL